jgi:hypothetical protein
VAVLVQVTSIAAGSMARNQSIALFDYRKSMTDSSLKMQYFATGLLKTIMLALKSKKAQFLIKFANAHSTTSRTFDISVFHRASRDPGPGFLYPPKRRRD